MNAALAAGKNLLVTPGVYHLNQTLNITRPDTVVLGMGLATLVPDGGITAISTADVDGIELAGLLVDAGTTNSGTLVQIGPSGSTASHASDPTQLSDVFVRIGGATVGKATNSLVINSANTIIDHTWIWRADHGNSGTVGWTTNTADTGLIVNGANVTAYGLFVEHFQKTQVVWNGNGGRTYFFQNEMPYDPPNQASWMNGSGKGYPAYKVAANVTTHEAWGLGSYCYFSSNSSVVADHSFEVPSVSGVKFHDMVTVSAGRGRHDQPHHQQHRRTVQLQYQRRLLDQLPVDRTERIDHPMNTTIRSGSTRVALRVLLLLATVLGFAVAPPAAHASTAATPFKVLGLYSGTYDAAHIDFEKEANVWFPQQAAANGFTYTSSTNWDLLANGGVNAYQVVLFLDDLPQTSAQRSGFETYMRNGGGFMGFHVSAFTTDAASWSWYHNTFLGSGNFVSNTWGPTAVTLKVEDHSIPPTANLPATFTSSVSEWYSWSNDLRQNPDIKILASIDPSSFPVGTDPNQSWYSGYYPIIWTNTKYKMLYANFGHNAMNYTTNTRLSSTFASPTQNQFLLNGLKWLGGGGTSTPPTDTPISRRPGTPCRTAATAPASTPVRRPRPTARRSSSTPATVRRRSSTSSARPTAGTWRSPRAAIPHRSST